MMFCFGFMVVWDYEGGSKNCIRNNKIENKDFIEIFYFMKLRVRFLI